MSETKPASLPSGVEAALEFMARQPRHAYSLGLMAAYGEERAQASRQQALEEAVGIVESADLSVAKLLDEGAASCARSSIAEALRRAAQGEP